MKEGSRIDFLANSLKNLDSPEKNPLFIDLNKIQDNSEILADIPDGSNRILA
jgi:hypothetical protein